jgi:hypothetical protein
MNVRLAFAEDRPYSNLGEVSRRAPAAVLLTQEGDG